MDAFEAIIQQYEEAFKNTEHSKEFRNAQNFKTEILNETDRGLVLFGVGRIDALLENLLKKILIGSNKHISELFSNNGPLSTFSAKIKLSYSFGLISKSEFSEINTLRELRNKFAHSDQPINFDTPEIQKICDKLAYIIRLPVRKYRYEVAETIGLLVILLNLDIAKSSKVKEKKDHYDEKGKERINKATMEIVAILKNHYGH